MIAIMLGDPAARLRTFIYGLSATVSILLVWQHWGIATALESGRLEQQERERFVVAALVAEPEDRRFLRETFAEMDPLVARLLRRAAERKAQHARDRLLYGDEMRSVPERTTPPLIEQRTPRP